MTTLVTIQLWHLVLLIAAILVAFWLIAKLTNREITKHLNNQDTRMQALEAKVTEMRVELGRDYVRREDFMHDIGTLGTKFEALAINVERMLDEAAKAASETLKTISQGMRK